MTGPDYFLSADEAHAIVKAEEATGWVPITATDSLVLRAENTEKARARGWEPLAARRGTDEDDAYDESRGTTHTTRAGVRHENS